MSQNSPEPATNEPRRRPTYLPNDPLLTPREAAAERGQAISTFWRDVKLGRVPAAIYVNPKSPRWRRSELLAALEACRAPGTKATTRSRNTPNAANVEGEIEIGIVRGHARNTPARPRFQRPRLDGDAP